MNNNKSFIPNIVTLIFVSWMAIISSFLSLKPDLILRPIFFISLVLVPSFIFCLSDYLAYPLFVYTYILRRFLVLYDTYISTYVVYFLATIIVIKIFLKGRMIKSSLLKLLAFILAIAGYDLFIKLAIDNENVLYEPFQNFILNFSSMWTHTFISILVGYYYFSYVRLKYQKDRKIEILFLISMVSANIAYLSFLLFRVAPLQRSVWIAEVIGFDTTSYTRVDPNFYIFDVLFLSLVFLRKTRNILIVLLICSILNTLYLNSTSGFISIFLILFFIITRRKTIDTYLVILLVIAIVLPVSFWYNYITKYSQIINQAITYSRNLLDIVFTGRIHKFIGYIQMIMDYPMGLGRDNAFRFTTKYIGYYTYAHNLYLQILADHGIVVGALLILYIFKDFRRVWSIRKNEPHLFVAYLLFLIVGMALSTNYSIPMYYLLTMQFAKGGKKYENSYSLSTQELRLQDL